MGGRLGVNVQEGRTRDASGLSCSHRVLQGLVGDVSTQWELYHHHYLSSLPLQGPSHRILPSRFGPRQIRVESAMLRAFNSSTGAAPYQSIAVADIGDVNVNLYDLKDTCRRIREAYRSILSTGCVPLTLGEAPVLVRDKPGGERLFHRAL